MSKLGVVSTVRCAKDDLLLFVAFHLNAGVHRMTLFFDDPADEGIATLEAADPRLACVRCDAAHWAASGLPDRPPIEARQVHNANLALAWARRDGLDWLAHIDSDELLHVPGADIGDYLARSQPAADVVRFPTLEAVPMRSYPSHPFRDIRLFKRSRSAIPGVRRIASLLGCARVFENGYVKGHTEGKSAVRTGAPVASMGIHGPVAEDGRALRTWTAAGAALLHFDCCRMRDWQEKWQRRYDGTAVAAQMRDDRKRQFADFVQAHESGDPALLQQAYARNHLFSAHETMVLRVLGLMVSMAPSAALFNRTVLSRADERPGGGLHGPP